MTTIPDLGDFFRNYGQSCKSIIWANENNALDTVGPEDDQHIYWKCYLNTETTWQPSNQAKSGEAYMYEYK